MAKKEESSNMLYALTPEDMVIYETSGIFSDQHATNMIELELNATPLLKKHQLIDRWYELTGHKVGKTGLGSNIKKFLESRFSE